MYCRNCGIEINEDSKFCGNCGYKLKDIENKEDNKNSSNNILNDINYNQYVIDELIKREYISGTVWLVIGILQIIVSLASIQYMWFILCIGIWNALASIDRFRIRNKIYSKKSLIVKEYEDSLANIIITMVVNIIFGAVIGIAGSIVDLVTRNFVLNNRKAFECIDTIK